GRVRLRVTGERLLPGGFGERPLMGVVQRDDGGVHIRLVVVGQPALVCVPFLLEDAEGGLGLLRLGAGVHQAVDGDAEADGGDGREGDYEPDQLPADAEGRELMGEGGAFHGPWYRPAARGPEPGVERTGQNPDDSERLLTQLLGG